MANPTPEMCPEEIERMRGWSPPAALTTPTRSTTCSASRASSAARSTCAPRQITRDDEDRRRPRDRRHRLRRRAARRLHRPLGVQSGRGARRWPPRSPTRPATPAWRRPEPSWGPRRRSCRGAGARDPRALDQGTGIGGGRGRECGFRRGVLRGGQRNGRCTTRARRSAGLWPYGARNPGGMRLTSAAGPVRGAR